MLEERNLKLDLLALGLLALTVFLGAGLFSYDQADPPRAVAFPENSDVTNICGPIGATTSVLLFEGLGLGAYYLLLSLVIVDALLLTRRTITQPWVRLIGWLVSLVGFSTLMATALPGWSPGPVIGSGGYLGAAVRALLEMSFATVGAYILLVSLILGGLLLATDYVLLRAIAWCVRVPVKGIDVAGKAYAGTKAAWNAKSESEEEEEGEEDEEEEEDTAEGDEEEQEPAIVISGTAIVEKKATEEEGDASSEEETKAEKKKKAKKPRIVKERKKSKREEMIEEIEAASADPEEADYELPSIDLLLESEPFCFDEHESEVRRQAKILEKTFAEFGFDIRVVEIQTGPVIAQFEVQLEAGLRLSKITGLADDLAIALRVPSVRIVAPIPGKNTVGIEVPNAHRQLVRLREVIEEADGKTQSMRIPIYLGKDVAGNPMMVDLSTLPHLLIAGRTGTGKSVCLNSIIVSILMSRRPDEVRVLLIDPKMVELSPYKKIPHLMHPVVTDMRKAEAILAWAVEKMEERYQLLAQAGVRHLSSYNQLGEEELKERMQPENEEQWDEIPRQMPYIVIVADEMADLMMTAQKEVETHIIRLAQKSRAVGIHLVLATQKPTVDVITGLIKSNLPARIAFEVSSRTDSRVVLDEMGAEKLLGNGDMLMLRPGTSTLIRGQGTYVTDDEINSIIDAVATAEPQFVKELVQLKTKDAASGAEALKNRDELYQSAVDVVIREGRGSVSLLQRALGIGYGRAARLVDYMEEDGFVGSYNGSQAREVLLSIEDWEEMNGIQSDTSESTATPPSRSAKILMPPPVESEVVDVVEPPLDEEEEADEESDTDEDQYEEDEYEYEEEEEPDEEEEEEDEVEDELEEDEEYEYEEDSDEEAEAEEEEEQEDDDQAWAAESA